MENTNYVLNNFQFRQHFDDREHLKQKIIYFYNQYEQFQLFKNEFLTHILIEEYEKFSSNYECIIPSFKLTESKKSKSTVRDNKKIAILTINQYELLLEKRSIKIPKLYMFDLNIVSMSEKKPSSYYKPQLIEIALDNRTFVDYYKSQEYEDQFHYNE